MLERCDDYLREVVDIMGAKVVIGVGNYAKNRATSAFHGSDVRISSCWHPSPASPLANRNGGRLEGQFQVRPSRVIPEYGYTV